ncbi:MAG: VWA domain-containing protein [Deltaproteobacteria bacterium]|nr:VWA domain-containing protein [Deltaproteobacteria bacterium]
MPRALPWLLSLVTMLISACGAAPPPGDPNLVEMSAEASTVLVTAGAPSEVAVRIRVSAGKVASDVRPPLDLVLLLDTSGSMEGAPIAAVRASARALVERLNDGDRLAIVTFDSTARALVPSAPIDDDARAAALTAIDRIEARGTTALADGLAVALAQVRAGRVAGSIDRIVLLGDGVPNDPAPIANLVTQARADGISITSLGFGLEFDESGLRAIASDTGGVYRYLATPAAVAEVFDRELVRMQTVVGRNLVLRVQPGPGVTIESLPGIDQGGTTRVVVLGDLASGDIRDLIVPLRVSAHRDGAPVELLDATLEFEDAVNGSGAHQRTTYSAVHASADPTQVAKAVKVDIEIARARAHAANEIVWAIGAARNGMIDNARAALTAAEANARADAARLHDPELITLAERMTEVASRLAALSRVTSAAANTPAADAVAAAPSADPVAPAALAKEPENRAGEQLHEAYRHDPSTPVKDGKKLELDSDGEQVFRVNYAAAQDVLDQRK